MPIVAKSGNDLNAAILIAWGAHPNVRLWRANAGQAWVPIPGGARPIQMNVPGCADLIGLLRGGRFLAIETKSAGDRMRESQNAQMLLSLLEMLQRLQYRMPILQFCLDHVGAIHEVLQYRSTKTQSGTWC